jgi:hypothetical protein
MYDGQTAQNILSISTFDGDVEIHEDDLALITNEHLQKLRMSRDVLYRCFAEGAVLMRGKDPRSCGLAPAKR